MNVDIRRIRERGQSATSYAAMIIVVIALVVAAVAYMTPIGERVGCEVTSAITKLFGGNPTVCGEKGSQYEVDPSKVAKTTNETSKSTKAGVAVQAGPGEVKGDLGDGASSSKTNNYDGSGSRSVSKTLEVAGGYEADSDKRAGKKKSDDSDKNNDPFAARLKAGGTASYTRTTTNSWKCGGSGQRTCDDFDRANDEAIKDQTENQGLGRFGNHHKNVDAEPDSTSVSNTYKLSVSAEGSLSANDTDDKDKKSGDSKAGDKGEDKKAPSVKAGAKVSGEASYTTTETTTKTKDGDEKTSSGRFAYKGQFDASFDVDSGFGLSNSNGRGGSYAGSYEVTRDAQGKVKTITFTSVTEGTLSDKVAAKVPVDQKTNMKADANGKLQGTVVVKTTLDVSSLSDDERKIAEDYAASPFSNGAFMVPQSALNPESPSDDPFSNLLYEKAQTTRTTQGGTKVTDSGGYDYKIFHWDETTETTSTNTIGVEVLDRPGADGKRSYKDSGLK